MDELRIGDADRDAALGLLSEQYALGRLTKEEFDERSDAVWSARTRGDLAPLFVDLPVRSPALTVRARQRRRSAFPGRLGPLPLAPVLLLLLALVVITKAPFLLLFVVAWFLLRRQCRPSGRWRRQAAVG